MQGHPDGVFSVCVISGANEEAIGWLRKGWEERLCMVICCVVMSLLCFVGAGVLGSFSPCVWLGCLALVSFPLFL